MEKIKSFLKISLPIFSFALTSCTIGRVPLDETQHTAIKQSQQVLVSEQKNIEIKKLDSSGYGPAGTGAIGVAITSIAINHANALNAQHIMPLSQHFQENHFNQLMSHNLSSELNTIKWLHLNDSKISHKPLSAWERIDQANQLNELGGTFIYVDFSYQLQPQALNQLQIIADVSIYKKDKPKTTLIYQNSFKYIDTLEKKKNQDYLALWAEDNGKRMGQSMDEGIRMLAQLIAKDIQNPNAVPDKQHPTNVWYEDSTSTANTGYFEKKQNGKTIVRNSRGEIVVLNSALVQQKHNWRE